MTAGAPEPRYRAAPAQVMRIEPLDPGLIAVFHRSSGITHLLAEPAPEILSVLGGDLISAADLLVRLADRFDLADADAALLRTRLDELVAAGLVEACVA